MKNKAKFKFNGGRGALLCSQCNTIIKTGNEFSEIEIKAIRGEITIEAQYCVKCKAIIREEKINQILD